MIRLVPTWNITLKDGVAEKFDVKLEDEILRVLAHGVLHLCGYKDKTDAEAALMRSKENEAISLYYQMLNNQNQ